MRTALQLLLVVVTTCMVFSQANAARLGLKQDLSGPRASSAWDNIPSLRNEWPSSLIKKGSFVKSNKGVSPEREDSSGSDKDQAENSLQQQPPQTAEVSSEPENAKTKSAPSGPSGPSAPSAPSAPSGPSGQSGGGMISGWINGFIGRVVTPFKERIDGEIERCDHQIELPYIPFQLNHSIFALNGVLRNVYVDDIGQIDFSVWVDDIVSSVKFQVNLKQASLKGYLIVDGSISNTTVDIATAFKLNLRDLNVYDGSITYSFTFTKIALTDMLFDFNASSVNLTLDRQNFNLDDGEITNRVKIGDLSDEAIDKFINEDNLMNNLAAYHGAIRRLISDVVIHQVNEILDEMKQYGGSFAVLGKLNSYNALSIELCDVN